MFENLEVCNIHEKEDEGMETVENEKKISTSFDLNLWKLDEISKFNL